jgi:hypothetical protein
MSVTSDDTPKRRRRSVIRGGQSRKELRCQAKAGQAGAAAERAFWAHLEDREEGRLAQEADHLFDTSYAWAA